ncbi:MAG: hypothetical protein KAT58_02770 [candidate division Zixibacteria bacterium]|nr:hypothetical protein [candidate division Zixibacteria bacterium]
MDDEKIISLHGGVPTDRTVNEELLAVVETLLADVKSGEVTGAIMVSLHFDRAVSHRFAGHTHGSSMLGELNLAATELSLDLLGVETDA